jgi:hypothetical protein
LCKELNVEKEAALTEHGMKIAHKFINKPNLQIFDTSTLTKINDHIYTHDTTLFRMGSLIEALICEEYLFGNECFVPSPSLEIS